jgi:GPH family glycoside/pentoside/hexuronide:cation symporter
MGEQAMAKAPASGAAAALNERLGWRTVAAYNLPAVGIGYMSLLTNLFVMKFSTDVLLIAPSIMATIFFLSRVWDAFFDPVTGYLSDRTQHPMGRRRIWILGSILPVAATFVMMFSPPLALTGTPLALWMGVAVIGFHFALTLFLVPHMALGAEITENYHERTRLFGLRHAAWTVGSILSLLTMGALMGEGNDVRVFGSQLSLAAAIVTGLCILVTVVVLRERLEFQSRRARSPFAAFRDVAANPHARRLIIVTFIENMGAGTIGILTLYVAQYVIGNLSLGPLLILTYMIPSTASVPMWIPLSRRFGKIRLWVFSMLLTGISFGGFFLLPFFDDAQLMLGWAFFCAFFAGLAAGCGGTIAPSVQSDIIDYDEYVSGERKEGSYFATWAFVSKAAGGCIAMLVGIVLQVAGYVPNVEQTFEVKLVIVGLYGLLPLACFGIGAIIFMGFKLDAAEHGRIRRELDRRYLAREGA